MQDCLLPARASNQTLDQYTYQAISDERGACLELAALQSRHRLEHRTHCVPFDPVQQVMPFAFQALIDSLVQQNLKILDVQRRTLQKSSE